MPFLPVADIAKALKIDLLPLALAVDTCPVNDLYDYLSALDAEARAAIALDAPKVDLVKVAPAVDAWGRPVKTATDGHSAWDCNDRACTIHPASLYGADDEIPALDAMSELADEALGWIDAPAVAPAAPKVAKAQVAKVAKVAADAARATWELHTSAF